MILSCGYNPKVLACDGTHIGISIKHLHLDKPVTQPDLDEVKKAKHQRIKRLLIGQKSTREAIHYCCNDILGKITDEERAKICEPTADMFRFTPDCTDEMLPGCEEFH